MEEKIESDGNKILLNEEMIPFIESIDAELCEFIEIFENLLNYSRNFRVGFLFNASPYLNNLVAVNEEEQKKICYCFINAAEYINDFPEVLGLAEGIHKFVMKMNEIHPLLLEYIKNPITNNTSSQLRSLLFEFLYDYYPPGFFKENNDFFGSLIPKALESGTIYHRSFMIQIIFALNLSLDKLCSISNLREMIWKLVFEINEIKSNTEFEQLVSPLNKLKIMMPKLFEMENPFIEESIMDLESSYNIEKLYNLIRLFPYFSIKYMKQFLNLLISVLDNFSDEDWLNSKKLIHSFDYFNENKFNEEQISCIYKYLSEFPLKTSIFFILGNFSDLFSDLYYDFPLKMLKKISKWKLTSDFNLSIFCFVISYIDKYIHKDNKILLETIIPTIFSALHSNNILHIYYGKRGFLSLWREDLISPKDFTNTIISYLTEAPCKSLKYYFKIIDEIIDSENNYSLRILDNFIRDSLDQELSISNHILFGYLLNSLCNIMYIQQPEHHIPESFDYKCLNLSKLLLESKFVETYSFASRYVFYFIKNNNEYKNELISTIIQLMFNIIINNILDYSNPITGLNFYFTEIEDLLGGKDIIPFEIIKKQLFSSNSELILNSLTNLRTLIQYYPEDTVKEIMCYLITLSKTTDNLEIMNKIFQFFKRIMSLNHHICEKYVIELKNLCFQSRLSILNGRQIYLMKNNYFTFYSFVSKIIKTNHKILTYGEICNIIEWLNLVPINMIPKLIDPIVEIIKHNLIFADVIKILWKLLLSLAKDNISNWKVFESLIYCLEEILYHYNEIINIMEFGNLIEFAWYSLKNEKVYDFCAPILLHLYSKYYNFMDIKFDILNNIGSLVLSFEYEWDYKEIIHNIMKMYSRFGTLHTFTEQACLILTNLILMDDEDCQYFEITDNLIQEIIKFLKEIFDNDDRYLDKILHNYIGKEDYNILKELFQK